MDKSDAVLPSGIQNLLIERRQQQEHASGELGQADFLELMVTQLENQDPSNPMESGEFLSQIAQFGTVNGIAELQQSFSSLATSLQSSQALQASTLVGREVAVAGNEVHRTEDGTNRFAFELPSTATEVEVTISDSSGTLVRTQSLGVQDAGFHEFSWDGLTDTGEIAPAGNYRVNLQAVRDGAPEAVETFVRAPVESVTVGRDGSPPLLHLTELGAIDMGAVKRVF